MEIKYILDGGHAIKGAVGARGNGLCEEIQDRKIVARVKGMLEENGYKVYIASVDNEADEKKQRYKVAENANKINNNKKDGALFISCHLNSHANPESNGVETYYYPGSVKGKELATKVQNELVKKIGWRNRGIKEGKWTVIAETKMPGILVELGFISNKEDMKKFNVEKISEAIYKALTGKEYVKKTNNNTSNNINNSNSSNKIYKVQCGAFKNRKNAESLIEDLKKKKFDSFIVLDKNLYKVQCGAFKNKSNAENLKSELKKNGFNSFVFEV